MTKTEMTFIMLEYLKNNPKTQYNDIRNCVESIVRKQGQAEISNEDAMMINEIVWDMVAERILTPGIDRDNLQWPWLSVTNRQKLIEKFGNDY